MGCDVGLRFICSPHLADFGVISGVGMDGIAFLDECLLASRLACSLHLTDLGVCLRIELACLLAGTRPVQGEEVYLQTVG